MADRLASARGAVRRASDEAVDARSREQQRSIDEGLGELTVDEGPVDGEPSIEGDEPHGDALEATEAKLAGPGRQAGGAARGHAEAARDAVEVDRSAYTLDH